MADAMIKAVHDTPNQAGSNGSDVRKGSFPHITCNNGPHGDMFMNYMDYVDDDTMVMFTKGQVARMNAALEGPRRPLTQSNALTPVGTERLALDQGGGAMAHMAEMGVEIGDAPRLVFDGVDWV